MRHSGQTSILAGDEAAASRKADKPVHSSLGSGCSQQDSVPQASASSPPQQVPAAVCLQEFPLKVLTMVPGGSSQAATTGCPLCTSTCSLVALIAKLAAKLCSILQTSWHPCVACRALPEDDGADKSPLARKSTDSKVAMLPVAATSSAPAPPASTAVPAAAATVTTAAAAAGTPSKPTVLAMPASLVSVTGTCVVAECGHSHRDRTCLSHRAIWLLTTITAGARAGLLMLCQGLLGGMQGCLAPPRSSGVVALRSCLLLYHHS